MVEYVIHAQGRNGNLLSFGSSTTQNKELFIFVYSSVYLERT